MSPRARSRSASSARPAVRSTSAKSRRESARKLRRSVSAAIETALRANGITHGVGLVLSVVGLAILVVRYGGLSRLVGRTKPSPGSRVETTAERLD